MEEHVKADDEVAAIHEFIGFLRASRGLDYAIVDEDVVVDQATGTNYDYRLASNGELPLAVEIFRLVDSEEEVAERRHLTALWQAIRTEFPKAELKDLFVHTPYYSPVRSRKATEFAKALSAVVAREASARPAVKKFHVEGFEIERIDGSGAVICGSHSEANWIDSVGIATPPLLKNLTKKDLQLATTGCERIALCANWASTVDGEDAAEALALMDTSGLVNIDKVYFTSTRTHRLVYSRNVRDGLAGDILVALDHEEKSLLDEWLTSRLAKEVPGAFEVARQMIERGGSASLFADRRTREALVSVAKKRVQGGALDDGLWAVAHFVDDCDPPMENYPEDADGTFNYHEQIKRGEHPSGVVGVRATTCWLIQRLICSMPSRSWQLIEEVERLATGPNLYVRQNACVPLVEFAIRRHSVDEAGRHQMPDEVRARVKALAFRMLRENQGYASVLDWLGLVFRHTPDLAQEEAREVMEVLLPADLDRGLPDVASLLVFLAAFRGQHPCLPAPFDSTPFAAVLEKALVFGREPLRHAVAYVIFKAIEEEPTCAALLKRYVLLLPDSKLTGHAPNFFYDSVEPLIERSMDRDVDTAILKMISTEVAWSLTGPGRFVWLANIASVVRRLVDTQRWDTVVGVVETIAAAGPPLIGSVADFGPLDGVPSSLADRLGKAFSALSGTT